MVNKLKKHVGFTLILSLLSLRLLLSGHFDHLAVTVTERHYFCP